MLNNIIKKGVDIAKQKIPISQQLAVSQNNAANIHKKDSAYIEASGFVYLLLDSSGSMADGQKLSQAKKAAIDYAKDAITKGYRVGLIKFGSEAVHLCDPQRTLSTLVSSLRTMESCGSTDMAGAIGLADRKLLGKGPRKFVCIATDGFPDNQQLAIDAARTAKRNGIEIITVGTDDADKDFLRKLATRTDFVIKVKRDQFGEAIASTAKMLPLPPGRKGH